MVSYAEEFLDGLHVAVAPTVLGLFFAYLQGSVEEFIQGPLHGVDHFLPVFLAQVAEFWPESLQFFFTYVVEVVS